MIEASRSVRLTVSATVVGSIPTRINEIFNILIFFCYGKRAKRGVEFRSSTCNTLRIWRKVEDGVS